MTSTVVNLEGVNAIVTGSTRGLGVAFAKALVASQANVVINGRSEQSCRAAAAEIDPSGQHIRFVVGRIEDEATSQSLVGTCEEAFGRLTFVVNNAGLTRDRSLLSMTVHDFDEVIAVHLRGTWLMCRAAAAAMKPTGGAILNLTSGSALYGLVGQSNYAAAKGGINALTRALSVELARYSIRVNALYPVALTDMTAPVVTLTGGPDGALAAVFGDPHEVAKIIPPLAADTTTLTGQILAFDGEKLAVWSHPEEIRVIEQPAPWPTKSMNDAISAVAEQPAPLNPDRVGLATREALQRNRGSAR